METPKEEQGLLGIIMNLIGFAKKYFVILLVFLAIGIFYGIRSYYQQQSSSKVKLVMNTSFIDNDVISKFVNALQLYIENGDYQGLATKLNSPIDNISGLSHISADTTKAKLNAIRIDYTLSDPKKIDSINKGLLSYLNNNEYVHNTIALKVEQRQISISRNKQRLHLLDSLYEKNLGNPAQIAEIGEESRILLEEIQQAEYENLAYRNIYILEQNAAVIPIRPLRNSLIMNIIAYLFVGLALSAIVEVIWLYVKREKQKKQKAA